MKPDPIPEGFERQTCWLWCNGTCYRRVCPCRLYAPAPQFTPRPDATDDA